MDHPGFGQYWQQAELSDLDVIVSVSSETSNPGNGPDDPDTASQQLLQQFPGHQLILSSSKYFAAKIKRWPSGGSNSAAGSTNTPARQQIKLGLPDASYEAAAMAVLAALYLVKPVQELLAQLKHQQLVQAAVLADMWEVSLASNKAVQLLIAAADSSEGLEAAAVDELLARAAVPNCLLPVLERALLSRFPDLDQVWADEGLVAALMSLPLHGIEMLLASDKLQVASEDTVLFTAQAYADKLAAAGVYEQQLIYSKLAPVVRCPHLSRFWRAASVLADNASDQLLGGLQQPLRLMLLSDNTSGAELTAADIKADIADAPASWLLPPRPGNKKSHSVQVEWALDVAAIKTAAQQAASSRGYALASKSPVSPPLMGITWRMEAGCRWDTSTADKHGATVGVWADPVNMPAGTVCKVDLTLESVGMQNFQFTTTHSFKAGKGVWGWPNVFTLGPMGSGFDEAVWAAKGLRTSGQLVFKLTVKCKSR